jgi:hypothetical protein
MDCWIPSTERENDPSLSLLSKTSGAVGASSQTLASPVIAQELAGGGGADARDDVRRIAAEVRPASHHAR